jgi:hypothetical protein
MIGWAGTFSEPMLDWAATWGTMAPEGAMAERAVKHQSKRLRPRTAQAETYQIVRPAQLKALVSTTRGELFSQAYAPRKGTEK